MTIKQQLSSQIFKTQQIVLQSLMDLYFSRFVFELPVLNVSKRLLLYTDRFVCHFNSTFYCCIVYMRYKRDIMTIM